MLGEQTKILSLGGVWEKRGRQQTNMQISQLCSILGGDKSYGGKKEHGKESWGGAGSEVFNEVVRSGGTEKVTFQPPR